MKILMFNNEFPPLGGGTGTVNLELFNIFKDVPDLKIDLITSSPDKKKRIKNFSENIRIIELAVNKKDIHHASNLELIKYAFKASHSAFKLRKKENCDLVFVWTTVPAGFPALLLKLLKKVPYIVRIGGPDIPGFEQRYSYIYKIISPVIKLIWRKAELLVTKCKTEKEMVEAINSKLNIQTIYNGVDTEKFKPVKKSNHTDLKLICSARLIKRKGQYTLIDAVSNLKKDNITILADFVGEGDEMKAYKQYAKDKDVAEQIIFSGYIPREKMEEKYQQADIFVLPSYNEGMSNALLEAMACGLPVIVTNVGGTEELVDETNGYIFKPGDSERLTEILKDIVLNPNQIKQLGESSAKKSEALNWQNIADTYLKLFNEYNN